MLARLCVVALGIALPACTSETVREPASDDAWAHLVGVRHRLGPPECSKIGGWLLEPGRTSEYALAHVSCEGRDLLLLDSLTHREDGKAYWQVLAVMELPAPEPDEFLLGSVCSRDGLHDRNLFAYVVERTEKPGVEVRRAWRVETRERRFREVDRRGVACEEPIRE